MRAQEARKAHALSRFMPAPSGVPFSYLGMLRFLFISASLPAPMGLCTHSSAAGWCFQITGQTFWHLCLCARQAPVRTIDSPCINAKHRPQHFISPFGLLPLGFMLGCPPLTSRTGLSLSKCHKELLPAANHLPLPMRLEGLPPLLVTSLFPCVILLQSPQVPFCSSELRCLSHLRAFAHAVCSTRAAPR